MIVTPSHRGVAAANPAAQLAITVLAVIAVIVLALWVAIDGYGDGPSAGALTDDGAAAEVRSGG